MRVFTILLLTVALATSSAGCFGKDDPPATTTTPPTGGTGSTTTTPTGATPTNPTSGGTNTTPTTPAKPAPKEVFSGSASFTPAPQPDPTAPTGAPIMNPFTVTTGYTKLTLNVTWTFSSAAPGAISEGVSVYVSDAAGTAVATCAGPGPGPVSAAPTPCMMEGTIPATGGEFNAVYDGSAAGLSATVQVIAS